MVTVNKNTIELVSSPLSPHPAMIDLPQPLLLSSDNKLPWPSARPSRVTLQLWNVSFYHNYGSNTVHPKNSNHIRSCSKRTERKLKLTRASFKGTMTNNVTTIVMGLCEIGVL
jgi:hypothetical protein